MKNYTSKVPAQQSIEAIEYLLVKAGALGIQKEYRGGIVSAVTFIIESPETKLPVAIRLPANPDAAYEILLKLRKSGPPNAAVKRAIREQAERTAWRLMYDWAAVQLTLIEMRQAELLQVFLPYIQSDQGQSLYQFLKEKKLPALGYAPAAKDE